MCVCVLCVCVVHGVLCVCIYGVVSVCGMCNVVCIDVI